MPFHSVSVQKVRSCELHSQGNLGEETYQRQIFLPNEPFVQVADSTDSVSEEENEVELGEAHRYWDVG